MKLHLFFVDLMLLLYWKAVHIVPSNFSKSWLPTAMSSWRLKPSLSNLPLIYYSARQRATECQLIMISTVIWTGCLIHIFRKLLQQLLHQLVHWLNTIYFHCFEILLNLQYSSVNIYKNMIWNIKRTTWTTLRRSYNSLWNERSSYGSIIVKKWDGIIV